MADGTARTITFLYVTSDVCLSKNFTLGRLARDNKSASDVVLGTYGGNHIPLNQPFPNVWVKNL